MLEFIFVGCGVGCFRWWWWWWDILWSVIFLHKLQTLQDIFFYSFQSKQQDKPL